MQKLTMEQAIVVSGYTGILACPINALHREIELRLGRSVWTHELGSDDTWREIKEAFKEDFLAMIP